MEQFTDSPLIFAAVGGLVGAIVGQLMLVLAREVFLKGRSESGTTAPGRAGGLVALIAVPLLAWCAIHVEQVRAEVATERLAVEEAHAALTTEVRLLRGDFLGERRLKLLQFAEQIANDGSDISQVYVGCETCRELQGVFDSLDGVAQRAAPQTKFHVTWIAASDSDTSQLVAAQRRYQWLECRQLAANVHPDLASEVRGSVFLTTSGDGWASSITADKGGQYETQISRNQDQVAARRKLFESLTAQSEPCRAPTAAPE